MYMLFTLIVNEPRNIEIPSTNHHRLLHVEADVRASTRNKNIAADGVDTNRDQVLVSKRIVSQLLRRNIFLIKTVLGEGNKNFLHELGRMFG